MKALPKLVDHPDYGAAIARLAELKRRCSEEEQKLRGLREERDQPSSFAAKAEALAAGVELSEPEGDVETRIAHSKGNLDLLEAAVGVQTRTVAEVRERVGEELVEQLRPQYEPIANEMIKCVTALSRAIQKNHDFANAMTDAGIPFGGAVPLGGNFRRPGLLVEFGSADAALTYAWEFITIAREFGYAVEPQKEVKREVAVA